MSKRKKTTTDAPEAIERFVADVARHVDVEPAP